MRAAPLGARVIPATNQGERRWPRMGIDRRAVRTGYVEPAAATMIRMPTKLAKAYKKAAKASKRPLAATAERCSRGDPQGGRWWSTREAGISP